MIIKVLLIGLLALLALFVALQTITSRGVRSTVLTVLAIGAYFVWRPEHANAVAQALGVGRGADLLMYLWVVITCSVILLLYLKIVEMNRMLTELARRLALSQPMYPPDRSKP
jgi:small membrane protein